MIQKISYSRNPNIEKDGKASIIKKSVVFDPTLNVINQIPKNYTANNYTYPCFVDKQQTPRGILKNKRREVYQQDGHQRLKIQGILRKSKSIESLLSVQSEKKKEDLIAKIAKRNEKVLEGKRNLLKLKLEKEKILNNMERQRETSKVEVLSDVTHPQIKAQLITSSLKTILQEK